MTAAAQELGFTHVFEPGSSDWTLLLLHGTGGDEHDLVGLGRQLAPEAALLSPRGQVLEQGMPRFFRRLAVGQLDIPDLLARTEQLAAFVAAAAKRYERDPDKVLAVGLSNGANIAASLLLSQTDPEHPTLRAAGLLRPMLPYEPDRSPRLDGIDVLIEAGERDPYSPAEQVARLTELLRAGGATVTTTVAPGAGHGLTEGDLQRLAAWVAQLTAGERGT
ncbi:MAG TPA: alpha/beta hydrolase [Solirubrobacteraceae bacterium]|jgi:predicted esterase|nr:alpha/beta hydrolase [Solirubrobacteraceae bacterium]